MSEICMVVLHEGGILSEMSDILMLFPTSRLQFVGNVRNVGNAYGFPIRAEKLTEMYEIRMVSNIKR